MTFMIRLCLVGLLVTWGGAEARLMAQVFGVVRLSEVWAHDARLQDFNLETRRFRSGPSSPYPYAETMRQKQALLAEIAGLEQQKKALKTRLEAGMRGSAEQKKKAEADYWRDVKAVDQAIAGKRDSVDRLAAALEFGGQTSEVTVLPEIGQVNARMMRVIQQVGARRGCQLVLSEPIPTPLSGEPEIIQNFWRAALARPDLANGRHDLRLWLKSRTAAVVQLADRVRLLKPVLIGGIDLTDEVKQDMRRTGAAEGATR